MKLSFTATACALALGALNLQCEPLNEAPSPASPYSAAGRAKVGPEPAPDPTADPGASTADASGSTYASGEYSIGATSDDYDDDDPAALSDFRSTLEPYGTWADDATYGTLWVPSAATVGPEFSPYVSGGHWAYDDDWVWVSDYEWGWAPFHYGRWVWIEGRGWAWIPGRAYRGAWVSWGVDDGYTYLGWAPLAPSFVWFGGVAAPFPVYVGPRWVYCPRGEVFSPGLRGRVVVGGAAGAVAARVRPYVPAMPRVAAAGPPPEKLGFQAAQIPRPAGPSAAGVVRAQQFAHPATAQALGGRAPMRAAPAVRATPLGRLSPGADVFRAGTPPIGVAPGARAIPNAGRVPAPGAFRPAPMPNPSVPAPGAFRPAPMPWHGPAPMAPSPRPSRIPNFQGGGRRH